VGEAETMIHKSRAPHQREMPGAEQVLPTLRFAYESGNYCDVTVGQVDAGGGESRIAVEYAWHHNPTPQETAEAEAEIEFMGLKAPEFVATTEEEDTSKRNTERWLNEGVKPEPERIQ
jgi:hypothetical protein